MYTSSDYKLIGENISIEKIQLKHLHDLEALFATAFGDEIPLLQLEQRMKRMRQFYYLVLPFSYISAWARNLFNVYICRVDGKVVGFIQLSHLNKQQIHLDYIAVSLKYRGQGIGTKILQHICTDIADRQQCDLLLEVSTLNPAYHLYQRFGFAEKIQLIHYEKKMPTPSSSASSTTDDIPGFRKRKDTDWRQLYQLYLRCIPQELRRVVRKEIAEFHPTLFTKVLEWAKNRLMGNKHWHYVLANENTIIGLLDIYYYPKSQAYSLSMMLDPAHEQLRSTWIKQALDLLTYHRDTTVYTTIYNDNPLKHEILINHGFHVKEAYRLMLRQPQPEISNRHDAMTPKE